MVFIEQYDNYYSARITWYLIKQNNRNHCRFTPCCFLNYGPPLKRVMHFALEGLCVDTKQVEDYELFFTDPD